MMAGAYRMIWATPTLAWGFNMAGLEVLGFNLFEALPADDNSASDLWMMGFENTLVMQYSRKPLCLYTWRT